MGRPQASKADLHPVGQNRPTPQENHAQKAEEKHRADRTRPLRHPRSRRRRTLDPKRMGRTLKLRRDTPSKATHFGRYPDLVAWSATAHLDRHPRNKFAWDWYTKYLSERDPGRVPKQI